MSRNGASKGGQACAAKLSAKERSEMAKRAAAARWSKPRQNLWALPRFAADSYRIKVEI